MDKVIERIAAFFEEHIGLNPTSLSEGAWQTAIEDRMQACRIIDPQKYLDYFSKTNEEQKTFIDLLVVPETWFFRHETAFQFLRHMVHDVWSIQTKRTEPLRFMSVPCSTGEEPYSMAMILLEAGVPGSWFTIDAVDISTHLLKTAEQGVYGSYAFRNKFEKYRDNFFMKKDERYQLIDFVKQQVRFTQDNIADPDFFSDEKPYDLIFCRNLFIYLQPKILQKLKATFDRLLDEEGILIVSPVETQVIRGWGYSPTGPSEAAAFTKKPLPKKEEKPAPKVVVEKRDFLTEARQEADAGNFNVAMELSQQHLREHHTDPEGYFLLGVIEYARGNAYNAEQGFRKALYLAPTHHESMIYLALIAEDRGNMQEAQQLRERAKR